MAPPDRLERVTDLLLVLLAAARPLSLREIADRVPGYPAGAAARRQAFERDKRLLRDEGVPVLVEPLDGDDQAGYRIDPDAYFLPDLGLTPEEQAALNVAVAGVHVGEPIGRDALSKLGLAGAGPGRARPAPLVDVPAFAGVPALPQLFEAVRRRSSVTFPYRGERRSVDPAGIRFRGGRWYQVGWDRDRGEGRTFRVDRVDAAPELGPAGTAEPPPDFDVDEAFGRDPWRFGHGDETAVDVAVDPAEARRVEADLGAGAVVGRLADGSVVVRLTVTDTEALVLWVLDLLDHAEVLRPPEVRAAVAARLTSVATAATGAEA